MGAHLRAGGRRAPGDLLFALVAAEHADHELRPIDRHASPAVMSFFGALQ
jgi:hypothetical protein